MSPPSLRLCCRLPTVRERLAALVKHPLSDRTRALGRFIPARAGLGGVHPEARTRPIRHGEFESRFIPARAGNTLQAANGHAVKTVHPRPRGEHPPGAGATIRSRFIPARAGNTSATVCWHSGDRFIPARAGNT